MKMNEELIIKDLQVSVDNNLILKGVDLTVNKNEVVALMGPNGSGKSTLSLVLMGHPDYKIESGEIIFKGKDITKLKPNERAKLGLFLSFQYPNEISGVTVSNFLRTAYNAKFNTNMPVVDFYKKLKEKMEILKIDKSFATRYLNEGFSGGEKKKMEILQMLVFNPELAILDETDSGIDVDALKIIGNSISDLAKATDIGILLITHYNRILQYINPDKVYIMNQGKIAMSGTRELADKIEEKGYSIIEK